MKATLLIPAIFFCIICSCNNNKTSEPGKNNRSELQRKMIGIWIDSSSQNALFDIRDDSIYYIEPLKAYSYIVYQDTLKINYNDWVLTALVHFNKDTMIVESEGNRSKYWKFKQ